MKYLMGFVAGLVFAGGLSFAQNLFPDPFQQQNQQFNQNQLEFNMQSYSTMRDGGISYQKSFQQPRNPC